MEKARRKKVVAKKAKKMLEKQAVERKARTVKRMMNHMTTRMTKMAKERRAIKATTWLTSLSKLTMVS